MAEVSNVSIPSNSYHGRLRSTSVASGSVHDLHEKYISNQKSFNVHHELPAELVIKVLENLVTSRRAGYTTRAFEHVDRTRMTDAQYEAFCVACFNGKRDGDGGLGSVMELFRDYSPVREWAIRAFFKVNMIWIIEWSYGFPAFFEALELESTIGSPNMAIIATTFWKSFRTDNFANFLPFWPRPGRVTVFWLPREVQECRDICERGSAASEGVSSAAVALAKTSGM